MKSKIIWSKKSKTSLIEIKEYFTENASPRIANRLVKEIINKAQLLLETPFAGQKDPFLEFKNQDFRYLIFKNYSKIIGELSFLFFCKSKCIDEFTKCFFC